MPRLPSEKRVNDMKNWLQRLDVQYKNLHRDLSDAMPVALILKKLYPRLVDMHNYPARSSYRLKLSSWETLNHKVLTKLGMPQSQATLDKLAKGVPGYIEYLLCELMTAEKSHRGKGDHDSQEQEKVWAENDDVMTVSVTKKVGDGLVQVPQKMILYSIYEQVQRECATKDHAITAAQQKAAHLENVIRLKDERIEELCNQLAKLSVRRLLKQTRGGLESGGTRDPLREHNLNVAGMLYNYADNGAAKHLSF